MSVLPPTSDARWQKVVNDLRHNYGIATVDLPPESQVIPKRAFQATRELLLHRDSNLPTIVETDNSSHATGYHSAASLNSMSRYNQHREGFVFSDGQCLTTGHVGFDKSVVDLEELLHDIASRVLNALEVQLELNISWFEKTLGPVRSSSQWHIKNYVIPALTEPNQSTKQQQHQLLPIHTDPSLITILIHDRPGSLPGGEGLLYSKSDGNGARQWVPLESSGHGVAVVMIGSLMSHITGGYYPACRHCVVQEEDVDHRMAATLFVRPVGTVRLQVPPSPKLSGIVLKHTGHTFEDWNNRVSRNYMKGRPRK